MLLNIYAQRMLSRPVVAALIMSLVLLGMPKLVSAELSPSQAIDYRALVSSLDMESVAKHIDFLSSLGSRVTGYPGSDVAAQYVLEEMSSMGLETRLETYKVLIPMDMGANLTIVDGPELGKVITAYPLWPNNVQPSPTPLGGIEAPLVYGGDGSLESLRGKRINGSIVLLEFNSLYWKNVILLGARAIVFIEPYETMRTIAQGLMLGVPFNIPRVYISRADGDRLISLVKDMAGLNVRLMSSMQWELKDAKNVVSFLKGTGDTSETIGVIAYYDSISVVPAISPGASDAIGPAVLIEIARALKQNPPWSNVMFIAVSGHYQGLAGSRNFVDANFGMLGKHGRPGVPELVMLASIDISSESSTLGIRTGNNLGNFYEYSRIQFFDRGYQWIRQQIYSEFLPALSSATGNTYPVQNLEFQRILYNPLPIVNDAEPFAIACGGGGISFYSVNAMRANSLTPLDTKDKITYSTIQPQAEVALAVVGSFASRPVSLALYPSRFQALGWGFSTLNGTVWKYLRTTGWYENVSGVIVRLTTENFRAIQQQFATQGLIPGTNLFPSGFDTLALSDETGSFSIVGLQPITSYTIEAFLLDNTSGSILMANDKGSFRGSGQGGAFANPFRLYREDMPLIVPVFDCATMMLTSTIEPKTMRAFSQVNPQIVGSPSVEIWNFYSHSLPIQYGPVMISQDDVMAFVPTDTPVQLMIKVGGNVLSVVSNSSSKEPMGQGYLMRSGELLTLGDTPKVLFEELFLLVDHRLSILTASGIAYSASAQMFQKLATDSYQYFRENYTAGDFLRAYSSIYSALSYETTAYQATMQLFYDSINTIVFFFLLLIPFSYVLERLIYPQEGPKRILVLITIFLASAGMLYVFHPGFHLASSVYMIILGFLVAILAIIGFGIVSEAAWSYFGELRVGYLGPHFSQIVRSSAVATAFSIGVNNMRRRRFRTLMNLASVIIVDFSMISFTSLSIITAVTPYDLGLKATYPGVLIKGIVPLQQIPDAAYTQIRGMYGPYSEVTRRVWLYPPNLILQISGPRGMGVVQAIMGIDYNEKDLTLVNASIMQGRWLRQEDRFGCVIPEALSEQTGIGFGDPITVWGIRFAVVGVFDQRVFDTIMDLDGESINPVDMQAYLQYGQPVRLSSSSILIIPAETARAMGGNIYSIAVKPTSMSLSVERLAEQISVRMSGININAGISGKVTSYTASTVNDILGGNLVIPLIFIAGFILLNTMLGNVVERKPEIFTYSSVGLSPTHVQGIFLSEPIIYALVGTTIGYMLGIVGTSALHALNLLPAGFYANYSSSWVLVASVTTLFIVLASSLYPITIASRIVTPSLTRAWRIPVEPIGDQWIIQLPFKASQEEIYGIFGFIVEYLNAHEYERVGAFQATNVQCLSSQDNRGKAKAIRFYTVLIPWDMPSIQSTTLIATSPAGSPNYGFEIQIMRETGYFETWKAANYVLVDRLREQFLIWRALSEEIQARYIEKGHQIMKNE